MLRFAIRFFGKAWLGLVLALVIFLLPDLTPVNEVLGLLQVPIGVVVLICALGKALYDTLFFDHYWP